MVVRVTPVKPERRNLMHPGRLARPRNNRPTAILEPNDHLAMPLVGGAAVRSNGGLQVARNPPWARRPSGSWPNQAGKLAPENNSAPSWVEGTSLSGYRNITYCKSIAYWFTLDRLARLGINRLDFMLTIYSLSNSLVNTIGGYYLLFQLTIVTI